MEKLMLYMLYLFIVIYVIYVILYMLLWTRNYNCPAEICKHFLEPFSERQRS